MPVENRGFGELFAEGKNELDHFQANMASVLPSFPGMPAAKFFDFAIGVDFHETIVPPSPLAPIPHIGMLFDTMSAVMAAVASVVPPPPKDPKAPTSLQSVACAVVDAMKPSVKVHGMWLANAGASIQHLPNITIHAGPVVKPMASSEMWMGSSTVLADGGPFSTQFHPALSCNLVGFPSLPRANKKPKPKVALMAPTSVLLTVIPGGAPVLVGGPPTIDLFQLMFKLALKGLGKLWESRKVKTDAPDTRNPRLGEAQPSSRCNGVGEPVDVATGKVFSTNIDFELPGPIPLVWERTYFSNSEVNGSLGYNWHHSYNMGLYDMGNNYFTLRLADGRETILPAIGIGELFFNRQEKLLWQKDTDGYLLTTVDKLKYRFNEAKNREGYHTLSTIEDKNGFVIQFQYTAQGLLKKIIDSSHRTLLVDLDELGHILRIYIQNEGEEINLVRYFYDAAGNMVKTTDALGNSKHFHYEGHLLVQLTNQSGLNFYWQYQGKGDDAQCFHTWGDGGVLEYWLCFEEGKTTARNSLGHITEYYYDAKKLIYKIVDANGGITHQIYNKYDELAVTTDPEGLSVKYFYDDWGRTIKIVNENEEATTFTYNAEGNLIRVSTPGGKAMRWQYDEKGRLIKKTGSDGNFLRYKYQGPLLISMSDGLDRDFHLRYDNQYNLVQFINPHGDSHTWSYDGLGRITEESDFKGNITRYRYDTAGNLVRMQEADGNQHYFSYDAARNLVQAKDQLHEVQFDYGPLGVLKSRQQHGSTVIFSYDTELQLRSIANEGGEVYRFGLDAFGQVVNEWGFDGMQRSYVRDGVGRVKKVLRPAEKWAQYEYDGTGNIVKEEHSDGSIAAYSYDKDGLLLEAFNEDGHVKLTRDKAGRLIKEQQGKFEVVKAYDKQGNCSFTGSNLGAAIRMQHNEDGFLENIHASSGGGFWEANWQRDNYGLELHRQLSGGISVQTERDSLGRVRRRSIGAGNVEQSRTRYKWGIGNRLHATINELKRTQINYEYDAFDNLISGIYTGSNGTEIIYRIPDKIGNLYKTSNKKDRIYGKGGQLLECPEFFYYYDPEGNLIFKEYKRNRNIAAASKKSYAIENAIQLRGSETGWSYEWASNGMLRQVINPSGQTTRFWYDPLGRRMAKAHEGKITRWIWDGNVPLHEWNCQGDYPPKLSIGEDGQIFQEEERIENLITWVFEEGTFIPCAKLIGDQKFSIITDYLGTPTHAFDADGSKVWERELDCYGRSRFEEGDVSFCPFMYQGQYEDKETGLYYNRFRYYAPEEGMYVSQDPIGLEGGNPTLFGFVKDTNSWVDVLGLECKHVARGRRQLERFRKKHVAPLEDGGHLSKHSMPQDRIDEIVSNPQAVFFDRNKNTLKFFKDGDVVVVNSRGNGITAYGKSDIDGVPVTLDSLTSGKYENRVFQIE